MPKRPPRIRAALEAPADLGDMPGEALATARGSLWWADCLDLLAGVPDGAASSGRAWLISPDGRVRASSRHNDEPVVESIDLNKADDKHVTPETDIFKQRRPELYQFNP